MFEKNNYSYNLHESMQISGFGMTDVGCKRGKNEDSYLINTDCGLYVVADGMGGHLGGEIASKLAITTINEAFASLIRDPEMTLQANLEIKSGDYKSYLKYVISVASAKIFERAARDPSLHGMGTTVVAALFRNDRIYFANVGDSRCYLIRGGKIKQLTQDHSLVNEQLKAGIISLADTKNHRLKNIITRSVGFQEDVDIDVAEKTVKTGDKYLLCTDGLTNMVSNDSLLDIASAKGPREACRDLIELANANGGEDNITVIITEALLAENLPTMDEPTEGI